MCEGAVGSTELVERIDVGGRGHPDPEAPRLSDGWASQVLCVTSAHGQLKLRCAVHQPQAAERVSGIDPVRLGRRQCPHSAPQRRNSYPGLACAQGGRTKW
jgi:hypothetical protein